MFLKLKKVSYKTQAQLEHPKIKFTSDNIGKLNCYKQRV